MEYKKNMKNEYLKNTRKMLFGITLVLTLFFGMVFTTVFVSNEYNMTKTWHEINFCVFANDVDPGSGVDGVVNVYIYPIASKSDVDTGCSEGTAYEHGDSSNGFQDGEELEGETPIGATYFIAIEFQWSDVAYNTTSADWEVALVKAVITCNDLSLSAVEMEEGSDFFDVDGTTDAKLTHYVDNSDAGWTMTTGLSVTVDDIDFFYFA